VPDLFITGIELQADYVACATANCTHNAGLGHFTIMAGDVRHLPAHIPANSFDHVLINPPYHHNAVYDSGASAAKTTAHAMDEVDLPQWIKAANGRLKHRGSLTVIYRADGLADLLAAMTDKFGGLTVLPLWPRAGIQAKRVIVQGMKDSKAPLKLLAGLILHENQDYSAVAQSILSDGQALLME
jgi:tRNA1(Val) A37 N6-methylase TrmN6